MTNNLNPYEQKIQDKKEYYADKAKQFHAESNTLHDKAHSMAGCIPFGQPILVGHHSEKRDRNFRNKISNTFDRAFETDKKAEYYADKASSVGTAGISSDDPEAIQKIKNKIETLTRNIEYSKVANAKLRKFKTKTNALAEVSAMPDSDPDKALFSKMLSSCDFYAYPPDRISAYYLGTTAHNAEIRRLSQRIKELQARTDSTGFKPQTINSISIQPNEDLTRILMLFPGKPDEDTRTKLKRNGFRWSPRNQAWQAYYKMRYAQAAQEIAQAYTSPDNVTQNQTEEK